MAIHMGLHVMAHVTDALGAIGHRVELPCAALGDGPELLSTCNKESLFPFEEYSLRIVGHG